MNEIRNNVTYQNGNRIESVTRTSTRADDCSALGNRYNQLASLYRRKATATAEQEISVIESEIARIEGEITEYAGYLAGYPDEDGSEENA